MDGLKLDKWKENFRQEAENIRIEFDAFFKNKKLEEYYHLYVEEQTEQLSLSLSDQLPPEIKVRMLKAFERTRPEDSI